MSKDFVINGTTISPGRIGDVSFSVGKLPSGTPISIKGRVAHTGRPGPVVLITGGVHGDEINSIQVVRHFIDSGALEELQCGTVIAIPVVNVYGFIYFSRDLPDGKDVNRSFPGSARGSLASRIAYTLSKKILPLIDCSIDIHTGGSSRFNYPQIRYTTSDVTAAELARVFAPPIILSRGVISKSMRRTGLKMGKPMLVFEGGESLRLDGHSIQEAQSGIARVLHHYHMLPTAESSARSIVHVTKSSWLRAARPGLFTWHKSSGQLVKEGEVLGVIHDPLGDRPISVVCKHKGIIVGHNNAAVISMGEALFHIGSEYDIIDPPKS